ncbi:MAG: class II aldolase/adducin family protein [Deltaproteobacteria bacterium]|nr:class II aldolase/adducin family protein [Deltaproteobacteria bacterium]
MRASRRDRGDAVRYARALHERGWVANHDGNITARVSPGCFLATPTGTSKADVDDANLLEVDDQGKRVSGSSRRFSEVNLHLAVYAARSDVGAVVHAHPPYATALACSGNNLIETPFIAEAIVSIGPSIPLVPFAVPGPAAAEALRPHLDRVDAVLLASHGVLSWGPSIELAYLRMELVEHLARIATLAQAHGGVQPLSKDAVDKLLAARAKAGLGAAADRAVELYGSKRVIACAPAPHSNVQVADSPRSSTIASASPEVQTIIREEIVKILSKG